MRNKAVAIKLIDRCARLVGVLMLIACQAVCAAPDESVKFCVMSDTGFVSDVVWGKDQFVAVGASGVVATSPDGLTWTVNRPNGGVLGGFPKDQKCEPALVSIAWGGGSYVAVAKDNVILTSPDGKSWQRQTALQPPGKSGFHVAWGSGLFVAGGDAGALYVSADGIHWQKEASGIENDIVDIIAFRGGFVAVAKDGWVTSSKNGRDWSGRRTGVVPMGHWSTTVDLDRLSTNGSLLVATGNLAHGTVVATSLDGKDWSAKYYGGFEHLYNDVVWSDGLFVMVGSDIAMSTRAQTWNFLKAQGPRRLLLERTASNGRIFVAFSYSAEIFASYDGANWFGGKPAVLSSAPATYRVSGRPIEAEPVVESSALLREGINQASVLGIAWASVTLALIALYLLLQAMVAIRVDGYWRIAAMIPALVLFGPIVGGAVIEMLFGGVLLWPLWPFRPTDLRIPLAILALIAIYMAHRAKARHLLRPSNSTGIPGEIIARSDALPVGDSPATKEPITASGEQRFLQDGLLGWAMLGLLCGAMPSSMMAFAIGPLPIVCLAIGQPILLKQWIMGPVRWFIWTVVAGIGGYFLGGLIGIPLGFSGHMFGPMIGTTVSIGVIALAQFFCLSPDGRDALKYWIPLNIFAVALITVTGTVLLQVSNFKGAEFFQFFKRHLGASDHLASLLHSYMFSIPQFLILCLALGCYVRWATSGSDHRNGDS